MISQVIIDQLLATPRDLATVQLPVADGGIPQRWIVRLVGTARSTSRRAG